MRVRRRAKTLGVQPGELGFHEGEAFDLARRLKAAGVAWCPELERRLAEAAARLGVNPGDLAGAVCLGMAEVATTPDTDALALAYADALALADRFRDPTRPECYSRLVALAYALQAASGGRGYFAFPRDRIAALVGAHPTTCGRYIRDMDARGLIHLRRNEYGEVVYDHRTGDAREARYTGPKIEE